MGLLRALGGYRAKVGGVGRLREAESGAKEAVHVHSIISSPSKTEISSVLEDSASLAVLKW